MTIVIHSGRLRLEMARRGWNAADLAREARLGHATVSAALAGRPVAAKSVELIARALLRAPAVEMIDSLIMFDPSDREVS